MAVTSRRPTSAAAMATMPPPAPMSATRRPRDDRRVVEHVAAPAPARPPTATPSTAAAPAGRASARAACLPQRHREPANEERDLGHDRRGAGRRCWRTMKARRSSGVTPPAWTVPGRDAPGAQGSRPNQSAESPAPTTTSTRAAAAKRERDFLALLGVADARLEVVVDRAAGPRRSGRRTPSPPVDLGDLGEGLGVRRDVEGHAAGRCSSRTWTVPVGGPEGDRVDRHAERRGPLGGIERLGLADRVGAVGQEDRGDERLAGRLVDRRRRGADGAGTPRRRERARRRADGAGVGVRRRRVRRRPGSARRCRGPA